MDGELLVVGGFFSLLFWCDESFFSLVLDEECVENDAAQQQELELRVQVRGFLRRCDDRCDAHYVHSVATKEATRQRANRQVFRPT